MSRRKGPLDLSGTLLTKDAAPYVGRSQETLRHWRVAGEGPPFLKVGRGRNSVRYFIKDLDAWNAIHVKMVRSTAEARV